MSRAGGGVWAVRERTASLTEGALLAALTALVALLVALFGSPGLVAAPLPLFVLTYRRGIRTALLSAVVAGLVLTPFFGFPQGLLFVAAFAPVGLVQGVVARRGGEGVAGRAVLLGAAVGLVVTVLSLVVTRYVVGLDPLQALVEAQGKAAQAAADLSRRLGAPPQQVQQMEQLAHQMPQLVRTILPAAVVLGVLVWAYGAYALARHVMRRLGTELPGFPPILTWRLPPVGAVVLALPVLAGAVLQPWVPQLARVLAANGFMAGVMVFAFFGVLTMLHYLQSREVPRAGRALAVVAVVLMGDLGTFAMVALGLVDLWLDLRKVGPPAERLE
ncbi:MAG: hypothetical protein C4304_09195 [candidate division GAL15 bacterium]